MRVGRGNREVTQLTPAAMFQPPIQVKPVVDVSDKGIGTPALPEIRHAEIDPLLILMHLPKTAGSTLRSILEDKISDTDRILFSPMKDLFQGREELHEQQRARLVQRAQSEGYLRLIYGHLFFGTHELIQKKSRYLTVLREPVDRILSSYYYRAQHGHCYEPEVTLADYVAGKSPNRQMQIEVDNLQTRFLCARGGRPPEAPWGGCTKAMLNEAKKNLDTEFALVGLTERFDDTVKLLAGICGWNVPPAYERLRVTQRYPGRTETSAPILRAIAAANELDSELYEHARTNFSRMAG
jgi:galactose-3-O-sulfotransferase